ncbi:thioredoxin family protein [Corynebacterium yudongzhengii]|uniref:Glutaredoxin family protein n=1 Tax=Corynebacterium yudongzhengii TaxID=2080740 RepID=A0A2U1T9X5_9CORY|nr:glutaredoxin family protein [Corynebacterium yudongzhengii]AWB81159.1 thioredoxin family protein [Corynebacterium yudongzhengii]PWC02698.1 glutaredoxin family protein [Corynebacterium yudongzhengii]
MADTTPETKTVQLMVRATCGSCERVRRQITPVIAQAGARMEVIDVDKPPAAYAGENLAAEFGDRVPVVVIDDEEFACWEVDNEELAAELAI